MLYTSINTRPIHNLLFFGITKETKGEQTNNSNTNSAKNQEKLKKNKNSSKDEKALEDLDEAEIFWMF